MRVEFTNRAARDLRAIGANSRRQFGERVAAALEARLHEVIDQITLPKVLPAWSNDRTRASCCSDVIHSRYIIGLSVMR